MYYLQEVKKYRLQEITHHTFTLLQTPVHTYHSLRISYGYFEFLIPDTHQIGIGDRLFLECKPGNQDTTMTDLNNGHIRLICRVNEHKILKNSSGKYSIYTIVRVLDRFRTRLLETTFAEIPEPHASLLAGILLGYQATLPREFHRELTVVGMLHVVAASGYNVVWVSHVSSRLFRGIFSRKTCLLIGMICVLIYTIMAGCSASVLRAAIMGILASIASYSGRIYSAGYAFILTCLSMVIFDPTYLVSVSFQLSVSATAGLIWLSPLFTRGKNINEFASSFTTTLSATLATLPITMIAFGQLSVISLVANTMLLWLVPIVMSLGSIFLLISVFSSSIGRLFGVLVWIPLDLFTRGVETLSRVPFASIQGISLSAVWMWVWWGLLAGMYIYKERRKSEKKLRNCAEIGQT